VTAPRGRWPAILLQLNRAFASTWLLIPGCVLLSLACYPDILLAFPIYDDVAMHLSVDAKFGHGWLDCFKPWDTGFFRPVPNLLFKLLDSTTGVRPMPHKFLSLAIHGAASGCAGWLAKLVSGASPAAWLAAALFLLHPATFEGAANLSNAGDTGLAIGLALTCGYWWLWIEHQQTRWLMLAAVAWAFALFSKETAVCFPAVAMTMLIARRMRRGSAWQTAGAAVLISSLILAWMWHQQHSAVISYSKTGSLVIGYSQAAVNFASYWMRVVLPFACGFELAGDEGWLPDLLLKLVSLVPLGLVMWGLLRAKTERVRLFCAYACCAAIVLMPGSFVRGFAGRMMYASALFLSASLSLLLFSAAAFWSRYVLWVSFSAIWALSNILLRTSGPYQFYLGASREWRNLVTELSRETAKWQEASYVSLWSGPKYGGRVTFDDRYSLATLRVFFPDLLAGIIGNRVDYNLQYVYRFNGSHLDLSAYRLRTESGFTTWTTFRRLPRGVIPVQQ
jgi:hypothetical protein